jgi:hypothetical protein
MANMSSLMLVMESSFARWSFFKLLLLPEETPSSEEVIPSLRLSGDNLKTLSSESSDEHSV